MQSEIVSLCIVALLLQLSCASPIDALPAISSLEAREEHDLSCDNTVSPASIPGFTPPMAGSQFMNMDQLCWAGNPAHAGCFCNSYGGTVCETPPGDPRLSGSPTIACYTYCVCSPKRKAGPPPAKKTKLGQGDYCTDDFSQQCGDEMACFLEQMFNSPVLFGVGAGAGTSSNPINIANVGSCMLLAVGTAKKLKQIVYPSG